MPQYLIGILTLLLSSASFLITPSAAEKSLATFQAPGSIAAILVDRDHAGDRIAMTRTYHGGRFDLLVYEVKTKQTYIYPSPVASEWAAWGLAVGLERTIYLGSSPNAHLMRWDTATGRIKDLGQPVKGEKYIWQLAEAPDGSIYGTTFPNAHLFRYNPKSGLSIDLGRLHPEQQYAKQLIVGSDGFAYAGLGFSKAQLIAFELKSGRMTQLLPKNNQITGQTKVFRSVDGKIYAQAPGISLRLEGGRAFPVIDVPTSEPTMLSDGRTVYADQGKIWLDDPSRQPEEAKIAYGGRTLKLWRLAIGPDEQLYASTVLPFHLLRFDAESKRFTNLGLLGNGEAYSLLTWEKYLAIGAYSSLSPLMLFDPRRPFSPGRTRTANPLLVNYPNQNTSWRPQGTTSTKDGQIYIGSTPGYGRLGGNLTVWSPATGKVEEYGPPVPEQSITCLTLIQTLVVGGTSIAGGGGTTPKQSDAALFAWDTTSGQLAALIKPIAGERSIVAVIGLDNDRCLAITQSGHIVIWRPRHAETAAIEYNEVPLPVPNSLGFDESGRLWALSRKGVYQIDPGTGRAQLALRSSRPITAGFAIRGRELFYAMNDTLARFTLPPFVTLEQTFSLQPVQGMSPWPHQRLRAYQ